ncbi:hypothetical protein [Luteolibacter sp. LG18]|uniref:hypothetical protein n=1 Tax=Luteolibacter sp. LG18 TaxID=2819286 RepID=UPI002B3130E8|nr:hypothetical protein llg_06540 [Luteolibacter sp. LG18]
MHLAFTGLLSLILLALAVPVRAYEPPVDEKLPALLLEGKTDQALALLPLEPDSLIHPPHYSPALEKAIQQELAAGHLKDARGLLLRAILSGGENTAPDTETPSARMARLQAEFHALKIDDSALRRALLAHLVTTADCILGRVPDLGDFRNEDWETWAKGPLAAENRDTSDDLIRHTTIARRMLLLTTCASLHAGNPAALDSLTRALSLAGSDEHPVSRDLLLVDGPVITLTLLTIAERHGGALPEAIETAARRHLTTSLEARTAPLYVDPPLDSQTAILARDARDLTRLNGLFRTSWSRLSPLDRLTMHAGVWCRPADEGVVRMMVRLALKNPRFGGTAFQANPDHRTNTLTSLGWSQFPGRQAEWTRAVFADPEIRAKMPPGALAGLLASSPPSRELADSVKSYLHEQASRLDTATTATIQRWLDTP